MNLRELVKQYKQDPKKMDREIFEAEKLQPKPPKITPRYYIKKNTKSPVPIYAYGVIQIMPYHKHLRTLGLEPDSKLDEVIELYKNVRNNKRFGVIQYVK